MDLLLLLKALPVYLLLAVIPGVAVSLWLRPVGATLAALTLFSAFSHVLLVTPVYLLALTGMPITRAIPLTALLLISASLTVLWRQRTLWRPTWRAWPFPLLLLFLPMLSVRAWFGGHGFWHGVVVEQLLAGVFPPENPGFAGSPHHYPWMLHLWYASLTAFSGVHYAAFKVLAMVHLLAVTLALCLETARHWGFSRRAGVAACGLMLGSFNIGALIQLLPALASWTTSSRGFFGAFQHHVAHTGDIPLLSLTQWLGRVRVFDHGWSTLAKFYNVNGMVHGVVFTLLTLWGLQRALEDERDPLAWSMFFLALLGLGLFYPVYGPLTLAIALVGMAARGLTTGVWPTPRQWGRGLGLGLVVGALIAPYFLTMGRTVGTTATPVIQFAPALSSLWLAGVGAFWPLLPLLPLALLRAPLAPALWLESGIATTLFFAVCFPLFGGSESYKYLYITGFFLSWRLLPLWFAAHGAAPPRWRGRRLVGVLVAVLASGPILLTLAGWSLSAMARDQRLHVSGQRLLYHGDAGAAWQWLAEHGEAGSALSHPPTARPVNAGDNYLPALLARRPSWFVWDNTFTGGNPEATARERLTRQLWGVDPLEPGAVTLPERPLYGVHGETREENQALYRDLMGSVAELPQGAALAERARALGFTVREVFRAGSWRVWRLQVEKP